MLNSKIKEIIYNFWEKEKSNIEVLYIQNLKNI